jgi:hypothetical protein
MIRHTALLSVLFFSVVFVPLGSTSIGGEVLQSVTTFVRGEILNIDGPYYTIKDQSGREVRLHVDGSTTRGDETFNVGDHVAADVTPQGHVGLLIKQSR